MRLSPILAAALCLAATPALADEGMWPFDNVPLEQVRQSLGVVLDKPFLDHLQASTVRLTSTGCSASLVSGQGLVLTNEHCALDCAQALSDASHDYMRDGFLTDARKDERPCPGMQAEVLVEIVDVTARVKAAAAAANDPMQARETALAHAENEACAMRGAFHCQAVTFYRGGQFKIYRYRRYSDVRLVFAPEYAAFFFGGDPDNFNFPRYAFDAAFLRLYENGRPVRTPHHLTWTAAPPAEGEPVFLVGDPGTSERLMTVSQLEALRDVALPLDQQQRRDLHARLAAYSATSDEARRAAAYPLFSAENALKVYEGHQLALADHGFMDAKRAEETKVRARVADDPALAARIGQPWADMARAQEAYARHYRYWRQLEDQAGGGSKLFAYARTLVRAAQARQEPPADRAPEYADNRLPLQEKKLLEPLEADPAIEEIYLENWFAETAALLPAPTVQALLGGQTPHDLASRLVQGTRLADPARRKQLWDGGLAAIEASDDPLIAFVLRTDPAARGEREVWRREVAEPTQVAAEKIARARFALFGDSVYPDATFSPRLSFGRVAGWSWRGETIAPFTRIGGLYGRATGVEPYVLAPRWAAARAALNPATVFDFSTTNDITGGNSGSPAIDAQGQVIGVVFDGNIHGLGGAYGYDPALNRTLAVSTAAITEALTRVYGRTALVRELTGR